MTTFCASCERIRSEMTDFQRSQIFVVRMVSISVSKVTHVFGISHSKLFYIMTAYRNTEKTASDRHQRERKWV